MGIYVEFPVDEPETVACHHSFFTERECYWTNAYFAPSRGSYHHKLRCKTTMIIVQEALFIADKSIEMRQKIFGLDE